MIEPYDDLSMKTEIIYLERLRKLNGAQRLETAAGLSDTVRELAVAGIRHDHPEISDQELQAELLKRIHG